MKKMMTKKVMVITMHSSEDKADAESAADHYINGCIFGDDGDDDDDRDGDDDTMMMGLLMMVIVRILLLVIFVTMTTSVLAISHSFISCWSE